MKSLNAMHHVLADAAYQLHILNNEVSFYSFEEKLKEQNQYPLLPKIADIYQMNIGKMCNQSCKHCHVDAGPDRKEIMTKETMQQCIDILKDHPQFHTVDLTGGAPELNPDFRWLVEQLVQLNRHVMVRCNLTIILANKKFAYLPEFYKENKIEVISSLPFYNKDRTDKQRGDGVFEDSIRALQLLNEVGYGKDESLKLNLVYNPSGAFLPADQQMLEKDFKKVLFKDHGIEFNNLYTITNMPISRYLDFLMMTGNYETYMNKLIQAFNPIAVPNLMCRNTISVSWDGYIYDCDFNQMLDLKVDSSSNHISRFNISELSRRNIIINQHCYGCTAGGGSSCGGSIVKETVS